MKAIKKFTVLILCAVSFWCSYNVIRPFWDRYWLEMQMETAAVYGTKYSIEKARKRLAGKMAEKGFGFEGDDFVFERDENNAVTVNLAYVDEVSIFGVTLKDLEFQVETSAEESGTY